MKKTGKLFIPVFRIPMPSAMLNTLLSAMLIPALIPMACREAYIPPVASFRSSYLVVEGFINNGTDSTVINLSRSFQLADTSSLQPEANARVSVEGKDNSSFPLPELGNGQYGVPGLSLDNAVQYRLHIWTAGNKEYVSDYLDLKASPPIDSVYWRDSDSGLQIYVNTHDPMGASRYYHWEYFQTWQFNAIYFSSYTFDGTHIVPRASNDFYTCWKSVNSSNILLASTAKQTGDFVSFPLVLIPQNSWMISQKYSILVKQYTLTPEAYQFWSDLQKNSEQVGSIFSPEPFQTKGNMHAVADTGELVIGYISAGTSRQQRIYITPLDIPGWRFGSYNPLCEVKSTLNALDSLTYYLSGPGYLPIGPTLGAGNIDARVDYSFAFCIDCRLTGTTIKPNFWP